MKLFISYSKKDRAAVELLSEDFTNMLNSRFPAEANFVWFDKELKGGHQWWSSILDAIEDCDLFIWALTSNSLNSGPCVLEREYASNLNKRILPVVIGSGINPALLPPKYQIIQYVEYRTRDIAGYQRVNDALLSLPAPQDMPQPRPSRPTVPLYRLGEIKEQLEQRPLTRDQQEKILADLREHLGMPGNISEARQLLLALKRHPDATPGIVQDVEVVLRHAKTAPVRTFSHKAWSLFRQQHLAAQIGEVLVGIIVLTTFALPLFWIAVLLLVGFGVWSLARWLFRKVMSA